MHRLAEKGDSATLYCRGRQLGARGVFGRPPRAFPYAPMGRLNCQCCGARDSHRVIGELVRIDCERSPPQHLPTLEVDPSPRTPHNPRRTRCSKRRSSS